MKLFNTSGYRLWNRCQDQFNFILPSVALERRRKNFMTSKFPVLSSRGCSISLSHSHWHCIDILFCLLFDYYQACYCFLSLPLSLSRYATVNEDWYWESWTARCVQLGIATAVDWLTQCAVLCVTASWCDSDQFRRCRRRPCVDSALMRLAQLSTSTTQH